MWQLTDDMEVEQQRDKIIEQLEALNKKIARQLSIKHIFTMGVIYGVGFFVGSAILATIVLGILGPIFGNVSWVKDSYDTGVTILKGEPK
ncbi:MAG: hypothetical protein Q7K40_05555 [bacterium]|nr:hypothetical protein [bacterium]